MGKTNSSIIKPLTRREKALATTRERGLTLIADGYQVLPIEGEPGRYFVQCPEVRTLPGGRIVVGYTVDLTQESVTCECDGFREHGDCKHRIGTIIEVARALRLVGPMLPSPFTVRLDSLFSTIMASSSSQPAVEVPQASPMAEQVIGYEVRREDTGALIQAFLLSDDAGALGHAERLAAMWEKRLPTADLSVTPIYQTETRTTTSRANIAADFD